MSKPTGQGRRGALSILCVFLVASAILRVPVAGVAWAEAQADQATDQDTEPVATIVAPTEDPAALLAAFQEREARLREREGRLEDRMAALRLAESELREQLAALTEAEDALKATLALADEASEADLDRLAVVYQNMKPKDAAALFEQMDPDFSSGFLGLMDPVAAAQIMTLLTPETAYTISVVLAGRNANVPQE